MCFTLVGGMDRLKTDYMAAAKERGHDLKCLCRDERNFEGKLGEPDALIIFTNKISHAAKRKATDFARSRGIPIYLAHSCGVSTLRECLKKSECKIFA